jgi:hypothetical protein
VGRRHGAHAELRVQDLRAIRMVVVAALDGGRFFAIDSRPVSYPEWFLGTLQPRSATVSTLAPPCMFDRVGGSSTTREQLPPSGEWLPCGNSFSRALIRAIMDCW